MVEGVGEEGVLAGLPVPFAPMRGPDSRFRDLLSRTRFPCQAPPQKSTSKPQWNTIPRAGFAPKNKGAISYVW